MSDKYQKEIEEILKNAGESAPDEAVGEAEKPPDDRPVRSQRRLSEREPEPTYTPRGRWPTITPGKVLVAGLVVFVITALLKVWILMWVGLGLLVIGYLLFFVPPRSMSMEKRWRGRSVENNEPSPWDRFKRWMGG